MSTVQTFQGVNENQKLSSRVLAPPGGKCSDLFGAVEEPATKKQPKGRSDPFRAEVSSPLRNRQEPDTKHRLGLFEGAGATQDKPAEVVKESTEPAPTHTEQNKENVHEAKEKVEEKSDDLPKRRVPPGGFSSKLW